MMERWENRYANGRSGAARGVEHSRADRVRTILIILLAVALLGVGIAGGRAMAFRDQADKSIIARMVSECGEAVSQINTLSRYGGSDSAALIGKIRANVHAVDAYNSLHTSLYGSQLVPQNVFAGIYTNIDSYMGKLKNGTATIEEQTNLANGLTALQTLLQGLQ